MDGNPALAGLDAQVASLPLAEREAFLYWVKQSLARDNMLKQCRNPAELGTKLDKDYRITPAVKLISERLEYATTHRRSRLMVTMPPQEGKTYLTAVLTVIRCLQRNPDARILLVCYSQDLANDASRMARNLIAQHGTDAKDPLTGIQTEDLLGLSLSTDKAEIRNWRIKGRKGGLIAAGMGGTISGRSADVLIIDDPIKGAEAADSPTERKKVIESYRSDLTTRLAAGAPVILIQTRWHEGDLAGYILEEEAKKPPEQRRWEHVNIPAVAARGLDDALGRELGVPLHSARGRTKEDWDEIRADVGERVWAALYQGSPLPEGGGLFGTMWFETFRLMACPPLYRRIVCIDPAETGKSDEAGIVAAGLAENGNVILTDDESGMYTSDEWSCKAVLLALATNATELVFEAYSAATTYERVIKEAFDLLQQKALATKGVIDGVTIPPVRPFRIVPWRGQGNDLARSAGLRQAVATGRCRVVGHRLATLEHQAEHWLIGQHQPDRVAAATIAWNHLAGAGLTTIASPVHEPSGWGELPSGI